jgi:hypothetical protein
VTVEGKEAVMSELGTLIQIQRGIEDLEILDYPDLQVINI